jgi:hypothetical protein
MSKKSLSYGIRQVTFAVYIYSSIRHCIIDYICATLYSSVSQQRAEAYITSVKIEK